MGDKIQEAIESFCKEGYDANEENKITEIVTLFLGANEDPTKVGAGKIRILKHKDNKRTRVLMRNNACTEVLLNHYILPEMKIEDDGEFIRWEAVDYAKNPNGEKKSIALKFPPSREENGNKFIEKFNIGKSENIALLKEKI